MRSRVISVVFLSAALLALHPSGRAQASASEAADKTSKDEVQQLRNEVEAQRKMIEELKTQVQQLASAPKPDPTATAEDPPKPANENASDGSVNFINTSYGQLVNAQAKAAKEGGVPVSAGWNGEHFFIRSPDGTFKIMPYGYVDIDYRAYSGDGAPPNSFFIRRARLGFQGNYGSHFDFAMLIDASSLAGSIVRDVYLNVKVIPEFQVQGGQFKVPYAQETAVGATNLDFVERAVTSLLYPSATSAFRSPGAVIHGDIEGGSVQYWIGAFNGKGYAVPNTTSEPEVIGRLRFYPFRKKKDSTFQGLAFGGSAARGRTRALSNEQSFLATLPDAAYTFFPQFPVNGNVWRYNGEFTYLKGPWALRGEYDQLAQSRNGVGIDTLGGLAFINLPRIQAKAWYASTTYLLTGEKRPENGTPKVKHPFLGPSTPEAKGKSLGLGAWELGFRYSAIQANEPGIALFNFFTPGNVATFNEHTTQLTFGINWYPNYWVRYMLNLDVNRLRSPSTIGALPQNYYVVLQRLQFRF